MKTCNPGRMLEVHLGTGDVRRHSVESSVLREYLGGRGIGVRYLWDLVGTDTDALDAGNALLVIPGALTGTSAPCSGRTTILAKGPATGHYLKVNVGGHLGISLKLAGIDALALTGRSSEPKVVVIQSGQARLESGAGVWGLGVRAATDALRQEYGQDAEVTCIGPAGEKLVRFASIMTSVYNAGARGGIGAVMGSKRLKAIVVLPERGRLEVAAPDQYEAAVQRARDVLYSDSVAPDLHAFGTARDIDLLNELRLLPTKNFQRSHLSEGAFELSGRAWPERGYLKRIVGCGGCIYCCHRFTSVDVGPYAGTYSGGPEYETVAAFGSGCGITDIEPVLAANALCNDLGLDTISAGNVIQWAMESFERGVLTREDVDNMDLRFGSADAMLHLLRAIASRQGIGDVLAEGVARAALEIGGGSDAWAVQARGLEQSNVEVRGAFAYSLAFAVNPRGPDHLHSECLAEFGGTREAIELVARLTGDESNAVPNIENERATLLRWHEDIYAVSDALGLCAFATTAAYSLPVELICDLVAGGTGIALSPDELMRLGQRIVTLERSFNLREGLRPEDDDRLPRRMMETIPPDVPDGEPMASTRLRRMLREYYQLHGWNQETGRPTPASLDRLNLGFALDVSQQSRGVR